MATGKPTLVQLILLVTSVTALVLFIRAFRFNDVGTGKPLEVISDNGAAAKSKPQVEKLNSIPKHLSVNVKLVDLTERDEGYKFIPCINVTVGPLRFPLCTYPLDVNDGSKDIHVRKGLTSDVIMEYKSLIKPLKRDPGLMFLDLGVHIGFFTIPAALEGHQVVAVEANPVTARITRKSLVLANVTQKVTLVQNGLSNKRMQMVLASGSNVPNRASTYLIRSNECPWGQKCVPGSTRTIFLNDLIPLMTSDRAIMKVDIQGSEIDCFTEATASDFFSQIDIPFIRMEWGMYQNKFANVRSYKKREVDKWLPFFYKRNYTVHEPESGAVLGTDWMNWPFDVVFKKPYRDMGLL